MKKLLFLLILLSAFAEGCRYDEGPLISFRSFKNRLFGQHTLIKYTVDGVDSLSSFNDSLPLDFYFYDTHNQGEYIWSIHGTRRDGKYASAYYYISFENHKKIIKIKSISNAHGSGPFSFKAFHYSWNFQWEILKLEKKDIKMKTMFNNKEYIIELN